MPRVKPFRGTRPATSLAGEVCALPYDVMSSEEAKAMAGEKSLLHITKPEIDFEPIAGEHEERTYKKAIENFKKWQENGWLIDETEEVYYIYGEEMLGYTQYGVVGCCHWKDYMEGRIKKHELTRKEKEDDRMVHVNIQSANIEPVFFFHKECEELSSIILRTIVKKSDIDVTSDDKVRHQLWTIRDKNTINKMTELYSKIDCFYVADGHHRTAAAARVAQERAKLAGDKHTGDEEYNFFMAVIFPESHLRILDYNRIVFDLNGLTEEQFVEKLHEDFEVTLEDKIVSPSRVHSFGVYVGKKWYRLVAKEGRYNDSDPIGTLDVTVISDLIFQKILNLGDLRVSKRIDFVGGIRGLKELQDRVDSGKAVAAFSMYPVSMKQLMDIADSGNIMPPKTTWFEPKLRSGFFIHKF